MSQIPISRSKRSAITVPCGLSAIVSLVLAIPCYGAGNAGQGKILAQTCIGCHGVSNYDNVYPTYRVPKLGGQSSEYLVSALTDYQSGKRKHATMQANVSGLSARDIEDIVAYFSSLSVSQNTQ